MSSPSTGKGSAVIGRLIRKDGTAGGAPIVGAQLTLKPIEAPSGAKEETTRTDTDGKFEFSHILDGDWLLEVPVEIRGEELVPKITMDPVRLEQPLLANLDVTVKASKSPAETGDILYVTRGGAVYGSVKPRERDIPVTLLNLKTGEERDEQTDTQGRYSFDDVSAGNYYLKLPGFLEEKGLRLKTALPKAFALGPDERKKYDFTYESTGATIHGVLFLDRDGTSRRTKKNPGLRNVTVELSSVEDGKTIATTQTLKSGDFFFDVPPGRYIVEFRKVVPEHIDAVADVKGDLELVSDPSQTLEVTGSDTAEVEPVAYRLEPHEIVGKVFFTGNPPRPVEGLKVTLADATDKEVAVTLTDAEGRYRFKDVKGPHQLVFPEQPFGTQLLTRASLDADVHSIFVAPDTFYRGETTVAGSVSPAAGSVQDAVLDIASYMPTASEVGGNVPSSINRAGAPPDLQQIFDGALIQVLGRKATNVDAEGFIASLNRSFALTMVDGKKTIKWTQRAYAVETELGAALSGAQASLYHLAKTALDDSLPLLGGLYALKPDFDRQRTEAVRSIARTEFTELVSELGAEGGPTTQRVDDLFVSLNRALADMETEFGFDSEQVNDVYEEQNLTSFFVIRHYVDGLLTNWEKTVKPSLPTFLGTKLVLLSRALSSVVESVDETTEAMDAVMLGAAERQTVRIEFSDTVELTGGRVVPILPDAGGRAQPVPPMLVGELMTWIVRFARDEGPSLIRDGGRLGVGAIRPTADRLQRLVLGAQQTSRVPHIGFTRNRVRRALSELAIQLENVSRHAADLEAAPKNKAQSRVQ